MRGPSQAKTAPTRAANKPAKPKLATLLRAAPLAPPVAVGEGEEVTEERTEVGVVTEEGGLVEVEVGVVVTEVRAGETDDTDRELLLPGTVEMEVPGRELPTLEEPEQSVDANRRWF